MTDDVWEYCRKVAAIAGTAPTKKQILTVLMFFENKKDVRAAAEEVSWQNNKGPMRDSAGYVCHW